jgi:hypothetical protein
MRTREDYDLDGARTPELLTELAAECGCRPVFGTTDTIQVDLDSESLERFHTSFELLKKKGYLLNATAVAWHSKGGNWHVVVTLPSNMEITSRDRIMYALMLGSDPTREILNMSEQRDGSGTIVLFRPIGAIEFRVDGRAQSDKRRRDVRREVERYTL